MRRPALVVCCVLGCHRGSSDEIGASGTTTAAATSGGSGHATTDGELGSSSSTASAGSTGTGAGPSTGMAQESSTGEPLPARVMLYVTTGNAIHGWRIDGDSGALLDHSQIDLGVELGPLTHDEAAARLYVGRWGDSSVSALAIDATTGALSELGTTPVGGQPVYLTLDHGDRHLLLADYNHATVSSFTIGDDGVLVSPASSTLQQGMNPHSIVLAPAGDFALVPNVGSDEIRQVVYDGRSGALVPNQPPAVDAPAGVGPRHLVFADDARHAWVVNESGDSITGWRYDADTGLLSAPVTVSTLPVGVDGSDNSCADLHLAAGGTRLYASNRGHDTLAMFAVDTRGSLTWLGEVATEAEPRSFAIEPGGRFLYAAGRASARVASYAIDAEGELQPLELIDAAPQPEWVEPVVLPR